MTFLSAERVKSLLEEAKGRKILVAGDLILDAYLWGSVNRISPEAPVPVVQLERESQRLGGAGNVARNLVALGAEVEMLSVVGDDSSGKQILELLEQEGIGIQGVLQESGRATTRKTRVIAHHQQIVRVDREQPAEPSAQIQDQLSQTLRNLAPDCDALIVEDYDKGLLGDPLLAALRGVSGKNGTPCFVDPKGRKPSDYLGARCLTPNRSEVAYMTGRRLDCEQDLEEAVQTILTHTEAEGLLVTRGEEGMSLWHSSGTRSDIPALLREVYDVTGAGDTVIATLAFLAAKDQSLYEAAQAASCAAAVTVQHLGTMAPTPADIIQAAQELATSNQ